MALDLKRTLDAYQGRRGEFRVLDLPPQRFLAIDGHGDPNSAPAWTDAVATLYPVAYGVRAASRRHQGQAYVVPPLEALWWAEDMASFTVARDKARWSWTAMLLVPDVVPDELVAAAVADVTARRDLPTGGALRVLTLEEGTCVQTLHVGSYDAEAAVLAELHERVLPEAGLRLAGRHHEVYLSDARRTAPERWRTLLRQPVVPA